ncbi:type II CAAX endopeptidase family protein [Ktedonobacter racemifer]|uniref:Abortive infection protein n=1 Tax=Ktedonobacter racemifer DSM 44963 TaxID=485913 RepID=D6TI29_KTERA|nr:type II CAAX endopeptidase family protein [Ktedonobacter racemifer]EFH89086.1 Abortive infection protein [Ktedonobacter racemifer DSM 44963]
MFEPKSDPNISAMPPQKEASAIRQEERDIAPWTLNDVMLGVVLTAVLWLVSAIIYSSYTVSTASITNNPLKAFLTLVLATLVEGVFIAGPLLIAWRTTRPAEGKSHWRAALEGLGFRRFHVWHACVAIIGFFFLIYLANFVYQAVITTFHLPIQTNDQYIFEKGRIDPLTTYATLAAGVLVAPICEEIFFRGFLLGGLRRSMSNGWAIIISAVVFALAHFDPGSFAVLLVIGLILGYLRCRMRSIWPGILLHTLNNAYSSLLIVLALTHVINV